MPSEPSVSDLVSHLLAQIDVVSDEYCPGEFHWDWSASHSIIEASEPGSYERELEHFLSHDPGQATRRNGDLAIIVGAAGSGKTTAVRRAVASAQRAARVCERAGPGVRCTRAFPLLQFDFTRWQPASPTSRISFEEECRRFWQRLASSLEASTPEAVRAEDPHAFWQWLSSSSALLQANESVERLVTSHAQAVFTFLAKGTSDGARAAAGTEVRKAQAEFLKTAENNDRAWYRLLRLAYSHEGDSEHERCGCLLVWLDNIDHCDPKLQRLGMEFTLRVAEILSCRALVTVRPLTWQRTGFGTTLLRVLDHVGPKPASVLERRLTTFARKTGSHSIAPTAPEALLTALSKRAHDPLIGRFFEWTCGPSIRNAIANYANALSSPLLSQAKIDADGMLSLRASELARALVFGGEDQFNSNTFENLYRVANFGTIEVQLIKPRLIDLVCRFSRGRARVKELWLWMTRFGYDDEHIGHAFAELLEETRPLLWYEDGHHVTDPASTSQITITPLGANYTLHLFGEYLYEEVCLARNTDHLVDPGDILEAHQEKCDEDLREVEFFLRNYGNRLYRSLYPREAPSLGALHWRNLQKGLRGRTTRTTNLYDPLREDFLTHRIDTLVGV